MKIKSQRLKRNLFYVLLIVFLLSDIIAILYLFNVFNIENSRTVSDKYSVIDIFEKYMFNKSENYVYTYQLLLSEKEGIRKLLDNLFVNDFIIYNNKKEIVIASDNYKTVLKYNIFEKLNNKHIVRILSDNRDMYIGKMELFENETIYYIMAFNIDNILFAQLKQFFIFKLIFIIAIIIISIIVINAIEKPIKDISLILKNWNTKFNIDNEDSIVKIFHDLIEELKNIDDRDKNINKNIKKKIAEIEEELYNIEGLKKLSEITEGLAHQINNYMGSIKGLIELYKKRPGSVKIETIENEIDNIITFTDKFLNFAREEEIYLKEYSLKDTIDNVLLHFNFNIHYNMPDYDIYVKSDNSLLEQALFNIFDNIDKYAIDKNVYITIMDLPESIKLIISDNGNGYSEELLNNIYKPFNIHSKGHGLGIPTIIKICSLLKHKVEFKNKDSKATVIITFDKERDV